MQVSSGCKTLAGESGITIGSLYHRYGNREGILAAAWLDALRHFSESLLPELCAVDAKGGEKAALVTPRFARVEKPKATILAIGNQAHFLTEKTPVEWRTEVQNING